MRLLPLLSTLLALAALPAHGAAYGWPDGPPATPTAKPKAARIVPAPAAPQTPAERQLQSYAPSMEAALAELQKNIEQIGTLIATQSLERVDEVAASAEVEAAAVRAKYADEEAKRRALDKPLAQLKARLEAVRDAANARDRKKAQAAYKKLQASAKSFATAAKSCTFGDFSPSFFCAIRAYI